MRGLAVLLTLAATPAAAHHEVVMATSMVPFLGGLATILVAGLVAWRNRHK